jgi:hypothetical protein
MSGIISGYNYDIFISYRLKDNKGGRRVSVLADLLNSNLPYSNLRFGKLQ